MFLSFIKKDYNPVELFLKISNKYSYIDLVDIFSIAVLLQDISLNELNRKMSNYIGKNKLWDIKSFLRDNPVNFLDGNYKENTGYLNTVVKLKDNDKKTIKEERLVLFLYLFWTNQKKFKNTEVLDIVNSYLENYDKNPFETIQDSQNYFYDMQKYLILSDSSLNIVYITNKTELKREILKAIIYGNEKHLITKFVYKKPEEIPF